MIAFAPIMRHLNRVFAATSTSNDPMVTGFPDPLVIDPDALEEELAGTTPEAITDEAERTGL